MSLELLISKYIDGELSSVEDAKLRSMLKENPFAKEKFDQSVELHMDLLEDSASISVPPGLLKQTEEAVMMKILVAPAFAKSNNLKLKRFYSKIPALAAMIAFFALINFLRISDNNYPRAIEFMSSAMSEDAVSESKSIQSNNLVKNAATDNLSSTLIIKSSNNEVAANSAVELITDDKSVKTSKAEDIIGDFDIEYSAASIEPEIALPAPDVILRPRAGTNLQIDLQSGNSEGFDKKREMYQNNMPFYNFGATTSELNSIQLNTFISRDFARTGISTSDNSSLINMSQSIGYSLSSNATVGLELGVTELNYDFIKYIPVSITDPILNSGQSNSVNEPTNNSGSGNTILVPVKLKRQDRIIWGMAFYDTQIIAVSDFSINSRLGLGATNDGPLGLGRVMARYNIFKSLAVTAGAEARLFMMKTPLLNPAGSTISSYGFIYGVQFNF
ncbi:MAG: hypothetical protein RO257_12195 [Candidatus Kapabacteria bacterium]|nr:hypothetical protein [Candidatus Kapabacteria bacterium]